MKKMDLIVSALVIAALLSTGAYGADDKTEVESVIRASYFNGAFWAL